MINDQLKLDEKTKSLLQISPKLVFEQITNPIWLFQN